MNKDIINLINENSIPKELIPLDVYYSDKVDDKKEYDVPILEDSEIFIKKYNLKTSKISVLMKPLSRMFNPEKIIR